jgi:hypothetical protein
MLPRFKIQYPMKNRCKYKQRPFSMKVFSVNELLLSLSSKKKPRY